jgi:hypothetical protein
MTSLTRFAIGLKMGIDLQIFNVFFSAVLALGRVDDRESLNPVAPQINPPFTRA